MSEQQAKLKRIRFENFTAFDDLEVNFSPGINVFIGENGTGKTHVLKAAYAACEATKSHVNFAKKVTNVFYPSDKRPGRLVRRGRGREQGSMEVVMTREKQKAIPLRLSVSTFMAKPENMKIGGSFKTWEKNKIDAAYIPVKDMMANAPGFLSMYDDREVHFEEIYADILRKVFLPTKRGSADNLKKGLLNSLQKAMDGKVIAKGEEFFLRNKHGELEFTLLSEGLRKLALLWLLIQNDTLKNGSVLLWDEPEANINPMLMRSVVKVLIELQRMGVQVFVATHDYIIMKEFDLHIEPDDELTYYSLYRNKDSGQIEVSSTDEYLKVSPNPIDEAFGSIIDLEIGRSMKKFYK